MAIEEHDAKDMAPLGSSVIRWKFWFHIAFSAFLIVTFVFYLPLNFLYVNSQPHGETDHHSEGTEAMEHGDHMDHMMEMHEEMMGHEHDNENGAADANDHMDHMMEMHEEMMGHEHEMGTEGTHDHGGTEGEMDTHGEGAVHHVESVHVEEGAITSGLAVNLNTTPAAPRIGEPVRLDFFVNQKPGNQGIPASSLSVQHEKLMHVIGVRSDLNEFFHIHPDPRLENTAIFSAMKRFEKPGDYKIWSEVVYQGSGYSIGHPVFPVEGEGPRSDANKTIATQTEVEGYRITIHYNTLKTGNSDLSFEVTDMNGNAVELSDYLGEPMHLALISDDLKQFIHAHPGTHYADPSPSGSADHEHGGTETNHDHGANPLFSLLADVGHVNDEKTPLNGTLFGLTIPEKGMYKAFAQFRPKDAALEADEAVVAAFWIEVKEGSVFALIAENWSLKLLISLVLMAALSYFVKWYVTVPVTFGKKQQST